MNDPLVALLQGGVLQPSKFPPSSRYQRVATAEIVLTGERHVVFLRRRFVPAPDRFAVIGEHVVVAGDRVDNLATRYIGDPEVFWQLCDANAVLRPDDLTDVVGRRLLVTLPEGIPDTRHG